MEVTEVAADDALAGLRAIAISLTFDGDSHEVTSSPIVLTLGDPGVLVFPADIPQDVHPYVGRLLSPDLRATSDISREPRVMGAEWTTDVALEPQRLGGPGCSNPENVHGTVSYERTIANGVEATVVLASGSATRCAQFAPRPGERLAIGEMTWSNHVIVPDDHHLPALEIERAIEWRMGFATTAGDLHEVVTLTTSTMRIERVLE